MAIVDMINVGKYSRSLQRDWSKLKYNRFMLTWINFRSGHAYTSEYGLWPEEYEQFFLKTGAIIKKFIGEREMTRAKEYARNVEIAPSWKRKYDENTLKVFKEWFLNDGTTANPPI